MKTRILILSALLAVFASCSTEAYYDDYVTIDIIVDQVGAGYCQGRFVPDGDAWYYVNVVKAGEGIDPAISKKQFMNLAIDEAYKNYINWRHQKLVDGVPHIADFPSHSLGYGVLNKSVNYLEPDTDYLIYCFVVDPKTNKPVGDLYTKQIHTKAESDIKVTYDYRINRQWDYVYPKTPSGAISENTPWVGYTRDSLTLREDGEDKPMTYFYARYYKQRSSKYGNILYGMYAHNNDGIGDGTSETKFEEDHIYYTAIMTFDGLVSTHHFYKFKWKDGMQVMFTPEDATDGDW